MRTGALLLVAVASLTVGACTATTSADMVCQSVSGVCISAETPTLCGDQLPQPCDTGYVCCTGVGDAAAAPTGSGTVTPSSGSGSGSGS
jgi:hypothetical protein